MSNHTAVIGQPIEHSVSPKIHNFWIKENGIKVGEYKKISLNKEDVKSFLEKCMSENYKGLNVTVPHKELVFELCDQTSPIAEKLQAINTVIFSENKIIGDNTDPIGFKNSISSNNQAKYIENKKALVIGAGGSARSIIYQLQMMGANVINANRTENKSEKIKRSLNISFDICSLQDIPSILKEIDFVVNTTSLGIDGTQNNLVDFDLLKEKSYVYDLIYNPKRTPFLMKAEQKGHQVQNGLQMLILQAAASFKIWHGIEPQISDQLIKSLE
jgi:shikimate dehydrogenase